MAYRELALAAPRPQMTISERTYDVDFFGMDDGGAQRDDDAFRFIFQLGSGLMIYLYVLQAGAPGNHAHFFHTFWLKDCAAADVDMEDYGAPSVVALPRTALPLNYGHVTLEHAGGAPPRRFALTAQHFTASSPTELQMDFTLSDGAALRWSRARAWEWREAATWRALHAQERLRFG